MNLFELFVKIGVKDEASKNIEGISSKLGKGLTTAAKIGTAAVGVAASGIVALTKAAVENYAEYEQLVGGVDTLFKDASQKVQQYAGEAYRTSGMSANDYMANATAFSASLISSLGGDTEKAAEYANRAMVSMSDNANKMGTSLDSIVQTYQSLSRGNMAMLDNLKLGYGGTKAELERLIKDAASYTDIQKEMGVTVDASSMSFDNIVNAIAVVQGKLGIAGATAQEAGTTIEGSVNSMKAAWSNLVTGIADKNADLEQLIDNLVTSVVGDGTESNLGVIGNIMPAVEKALDGAADLVDRMFPIIIDKIPEFIIKFLPKLAKSAVKIIETLVNSLSENSDELTEVSLEVIITLAEGLVKFLPKLIEKAPDIIFGIVNALVDYFPEIIKLGGNIVEGVWKGILGAAGKFKENIKSFFSGIVNSVKETLGIHSPSKVFAEIGGYMAEGVGEGWDDEFGNIKRDINNSLDFGDGYIGTFGGSYDSSYIGSGSVGRPINITQNIYAQKKSAAQLMQEARWQAQMGVLANA